MFSKSAPKPGALALLTISAVLSLPSGCMHFSRDEEPVVESLVFPESGEFTEPDVMLTRRVVLERGSAPSKSLFGDKSADVTATSHFGKEHEVADISCVVAGISETLKQPRIIASEEFWQAAKASGETLRLPCLLDTQCSSVIEDLQLDFVIAAYHQRINVYSFAGEAIVEGGIRTEDRETAAVVTVATKAGRTVDAAQITGRHHRIFYHGIMILSGTISPSEDPCVLAGKRAGEVISKMSPGNSSPRIAVLATANNPYAASVTSSIEPESKSRLGEMARTGEAEAGLSEGEVLWLAVSGNPEAQLQAYWNLVASDADQALYWLCMAANQGYPAAQYQDGLLMKKDDKVAAYVWFSLAARAGHRGAKDELKPLIAGMTNDELAQAEKGLSDWQPGQCEPLDVPTAERLTGTSEPGSDAATLPEDPDYVAKHQAEKEQLRLSLKRRAEQGDPEAQFELYFLEDAASPKWLCRAADQGYKKAEMWLGRAFANGTSGFPLDNRRALVWYRRAALGPHREETAEALKAFEIMYKKKGEAYSCKGMPCLVARDIFFTRKKLDHKALAESEALFDQWAPGQCERDLGQTTESHTKAVPTAN